MALLVGVTIAVMKLHDQSNLGKKEFISLIVPYNGLSSKAMRAGTQKGQKSGGGSRYRDHEECCCLLNCSPWLAQPSFL